MVYVNEIIKLRKRNSELRKRNRDLITQITISRPNYNKIKEDLEVKFATYKSDLERDRFLARFRRSMNQNFLLQKEYEELKSMNKILIDKIDAMEVKIDKDREKVDAMEVVTTLLRTKLEDIEFQNFINDVFRFMRDGIIAKHSSTDFPNGVSALLY